MQYIPLSQQIEVQNTMLLGGRLSCLQVQINPSQMPYAENHHNNNNIIKIQVSGTGPIFSKHLKVKISLNSNFSKFHLSTNSFKLDKDS